MASGTFLGVFHGIAPPAASGAGRAARTRLESLWRQLPTPSNVQSMLLQTIDMLDHHSTPLLLTAVDSPRFIRAFSLWLTLAGTSLLSLSGPSLCPPPQPHEIGACISRLQTAGLLDQRSQLAVQRAADALLHQLVDDVCQSRAWTRGVAVEVDARVRGDFARLIGLFLGAEASQQLVDDFADLGLKKLGERRARDFFAIVEQRGLGLDGCRGALDDLKICMQKPLLRLYLLRDFTQRLQGQLLQPGRSTVDILDIFVRIVHRLKVIDPHGSLLNDVGKSFREYMRLRDDAVRIMLVNFLEGCRADAPQTPPDFDEYSENIANSVRKEGSKYVGEFYEGMDLKDLSWNPEPIDATAGHQETQTLDDLGHLIKLAEQKTFVTDLQLLYRARLLGPGTAKDYVQEMDLLQLLKRRFDQESSFQNVEVMLNDVLSSHRLHNDLPSQLFDIPCTTRVLSRAYWSKTDPEDFDLPPPLQACAERFTHAYRSTKPQRSLAYAKQLGHATVSLSFADGRTVTEDVTTPQASVIHSFAAQPTQSVPALASSLHMDPMLARACVAFWVSRRVLGQTRRADPDTFSVLEHLDRDEAQAASTPVARAALADASAAADEATALKSSADLLRENGIVYGNFIAALLTNQGGMPAARVHMILGAMMPGGFPFELADLVGFLREMGEHGRIESAGGVWKIKR